MNFKRVGLEEASPNCAEFINHVCKHGQEKSILMNQSASLPANRCILIISLICEDKYCKNQVYCLKLLYTLTGEYHVVTIKVSVISCSNPINYV